MEDSTLIQLWHQYDQKLDRNLQLNYKIIREMQNRKYEDHISAFRRSQITGVIAGILWIMLLVFLLVNTLNNPFFVVSVGLITLFNIFAVAAYIRHLALLDQVDITGSITESQKKLATIQASLTNVGRILILQSPLYCTFWYNQHLVDHGGSTFWSINLSIVALFTIGSIYLFNKLTQKNIHIGWVRFFLESFGGKKLIRAIEFLNELEEYEGSGGQGK